MSVILNEAEQIIALSAGDTVTRPRMAVKRIILNATAAGVFVLKVGNASMSISNSATVLMATLELERHVNSVTLTSGPAGAVAYVMLEQKM